MAITVFNTTRYTPSTGAYTGVYDLIIMDPASGQSKTWPNAMNSSDAFAGWIDESHVGLHRDPWAVLNVDTGAYRRVDPHATGYYIVTCMPAPPQSDGYLITWGSRPHETKFLYSVAFAKKDFRRGKVIWQEVPKDGTENNSPAIDSMGEWVAWTQCMTTGNGYSTVVIKNVKAPWGALPEVIMSGYQWHPQFCDWSEDGKLLVIGEDKGFKGLLLLDKSGKVLNHIPTDKLPWKAHWRHYRHR